MAIYGSRLRRENSSFTLINTQHIFDPSPWAAGTRGALRVEYHGAAYSGWQAQPHLVAETVQEALEDALSKVANQSIRTHCAGRTDAGVHGVGQVAHFDDPVGRSSKAWVMGANSYLPPDIRVHWVHSVPSSFHARHSALWRRYRYVIANTPVRPAQLAHLVAWQRRALDVANMQAAAEALIGEHDFSAFRAAQCQANSPFRHIYALDLHRWQDFILLDVTANAFLHHMVRNIAGALMLIGTGHRPVPWLQELLDSRDRTIGADTASGAGLYLTAVGYPDEYGLPDPPTGPSWLTGCL